MSRLPSRVSAGSLPGSDPVRSQVAAPCLLAFDGLEFPSVAPDETPNALVSCVERFLEAAGGPD